MALWSKPRPFLEPELEQWHLETWETLIAATGGLDALKHRPLVTPTREFFPPTEATGHQRVEHVFNQVRKLAGLEDRPVHFHAAVTVADEASAKPVIMHDMPFPGGVYIGGAEPVIAYRAELADRPGPLVTVLIHELAHLMLAPLPRFPGGKLVNERATDLATVVLGFGLFGAAHAFYSGPSPRRWLYLDQREWCFALAVMFEIKEQDHTPYVRYLKPIVAAEVARARRSLQRRPRCIAGLLEAATRRSDAVASPQA